MSKNEKSKPRPGVVKRPNGAGMVCIACEDGTEVWAFAESLIVDIGSFYADGETLWEVDVRAPSIAACYTVQSELSHGDAHALAESIARELEAARG